MRRLAKRAAEIMLVGSGIPRLGRRWHRDRPLILAYHNIVPDGRKPRGERSLHVERKDFAEHMKILSRTHEVVPLDELWKADGVRPRAAVTFDDAYRGALVLGVDELRRRGIPATVFVCPGLLGGIGFWWDLLARDFGGALPRQVRDECLWRLKGRQEGVLEWWGGSREPSDEWLRSGSEEELKDAVQAAEIQLASHTWGHPNLAALEPEEINREIGRADAWLRERFDSIVPWISYPFGLHSPSVQNVAAARHRGGLRVSGGFAPSRFPVAVPERFSLPRLNVPSGVSNANFLLRLSGLVPLREVV